MTARFPRQMASVVCLFCALLAARAFAQPKRFRPNDNYAQVGKPDQEAGRKILQTFRSHGLYPGQHYLEFNLTILPRRGDERTIAGRLWGTHDDQGNLTRIVLASGVAGQETRLLVRVGPTSAAWSFVPGQSTAVQPLGAAALFQPLAGSDVTAFDLEMPFLYWNDFVFEGVSKVRGRPANVFLMKPSAGAIPAAEKLTGVRVYLDTEYSAVVEFQEIDAEDQAIKTVSTLDLKKVDDQWIVKSIDYRVEATHNKSRFTVTAAAENQEFSPALFEPAVLAEPIQPPAPSAITKIAP